ncbi:MAG: glycoside hydrolase family 65 protein [Xanthomonadaceae bacterium]|nr:glycoside hydrolase family 65 protein [Xanthomonadaceae bacterium]
MKLPRLVRAVPVLLAAALAMPVSAATDPSFLLQATAADWGAYFPTYLANGYFSIMTSPRGTEPSPGYLVAFMDYTPGDVSRPAAVPGWSEVDYNPGGGWLNATPLNERTFADYAQTLDMHDGTLSTRYRFAYAGKATDVRVTTFVSQAQSHLAATQFEITPRFDGEVRLRFPIRLWSGHEPRFALARLSGPQMVDAVIASGQNLDNKPVPTPDRAPIWYYGQTRIVADGGDAKRLTLWLDGRAVNGTRMGEALALGLPRGLTLTRVRLEQRRDVLSLNLTAHVEKGRTYRFSKYVALSRQGWGGAAQADVALAEAARRRGFAALLSGHRAAWHRLWESDIVVDGDAGAQKALHSDLYYLLSGTTAGTSWSVGACSLTPGYAGHVFWDADSWVFPALLLLHPQRARSIVMFRDRTLAAARARAKQYGVRGAMFAWEADPETGVDNTPYFARGVQREIHVNADIAIAQWQYYLATRDRDWLVRHGWPVIRDVARFWTSRVTYDRKHERYEILHVTSPDEAYDDVPNDSFTNAAAAKSLRIAVAAAAAVGAAPDPHWADIAAKMYIPFSDREQRHLDFDASVPHDKITWMGSSLVWLMYPNLDLPMSPQVRRNDFDFQLRELEVHGNDPNEMMMVMMAVAAAELGDAKVADEWIRRNLVGFLKPPFNVRTETVANNAGYLLSTSAGFVESFLYGLTGLRIEDQGLVGAYAPVLPPGWTSLTLKNVRFRGQRLDITVHRDAAGKTVLQRLPAQAEPARAASLRSAIGGDGTTGTATATRQGDRR